MINSIEEGVGTRWNNCFKQEVEEIIVCMTMESTEDLAHRYYDMSSWGEMLRSLQKMEKAMEVSGNHPDIEDGARKMQEAELWDSIFEWGEELETEPKVMGSQGNHPSTESPVFETPGRAQQGNNEEQVEHVKPRVLHFEDPAEVGITGGKPNLLGGVADGVNKMEEAMYKMYGGYNMNELTGKTPAGEGIHGAQPCIGERESAVREKHEHGLLRCGRPPDE